MIMAVRVVRAPHRGAATLRHMRPTIFHLIGPPAAGKYTVAKELAALSGARLVDNHAIANVIFNVLDQDGVKPLPVGIWPQVGKVRRAVLETIVQFSPGEMSFVFTNYLRGEDPDELASFEKVVALADIRASLFVPVLLSCETGELVRRVGNDSRRERMKLLDPVEAARLNDEVPAFTTDHPNTLRLDTTSTPPHAAAEQIIEWAAKLN